MGSISETLRSPASGVSKDVLEKFTHPALCIQDGSRISGDIHLK